MEPGWIAPVVRLLVPGGLAVRHRQSGSPRRHNAIPTPVPDAGAMTTNATAISPTVKPATVVLDPLFRDALRT